MLQLQLKTIFSFNAQPLFLFFYHLPSSSSHGLSTGRESAWCFAVGGSPHVWASCLHDPCFWPEKWNTVSPSGEDTIPSLFRHKMKRWFSQNKPKHLKLVFVAVCLWDIWIIYKFSEGEKKTYAWKSNNINILISQYDTDDQTYPMWSCKL